MKRLVQTSRGWIELDIDEPEFVGFHVSVVAFGEGGWATADETWNAKWPVDGKSLEMFLADVGGIPVDEAEEIADALILEWRERRDEDSDRGEQRKVLAILAATLALASLGALALIALTVLLVLRLA